MPKQSLGKTGSAPVVKQGHTTTGLYGGDPQTKAKGSRKVRELSK